MVSSLWNQEARFRHLQRVSLPPVLLSGPSVSRAGGGDQKRAGELVASHGAWPFGGEVRDSCEGPWGGGRGRPGAGGLAGALTRSLTRSDRRSGCRPAP